MRNPIIAAGVALGLVIGLIVGWTFLNPGFAAAQLADAVARTSGRTLTVDGGAHLQFSPQLAIRLDGVTLSNPPGQPGYLLTAPEAVVPVSWSDLFARRLGPRDIRLMRPVINLTSRNAGTASWAGDEEQKSDRAAAADTVKISGEHAVVIYANENSGEAMTLEDTNFSAEIGDGVSIEGTTAVKGRLVSFNGFIQSLARSAAEGSPAEFELSTPELKLGFTGRLANEQGLAFAGQVTAEAPDARSAAAWLGLALPGETALKDSALTAKIDSVATAIKLKDADFSVSGQNFTGDISVDARRAPYAVKGALAAPALDLAALGFAKPDKIVLTALKALNCDLRIDVQRLKAGWLAAGPVKAGLVIREGLLDLKILEASMGEGAVSGTITLNGAAQVPAAEADLAFGGFVVNEGPATGTFEGTASLSATGATIDDMLGSLTGAAKVSIRQGTVNGISAAALAVKAAQKGWPQTGSIAFDEAKAGFKISDGILSTSDFALQSDTLKAAGSGEIDLLRRALDVKLTLGTGRVAIKGPWGTPAISPEAGTQ